MLQPKNGLRYLTSMSSVWFGPAGDGTHDLPVLGRHYTAPNGSVKCVAFIFCVKMPKMKEVSLDNPTVWGVPAWCLIANRLVCVFGRVVEMTTDQEPLVGQSAVAAAFAVRGVDVSPNQGRGVMKVSLSARPSSCSSPGKCLCALTSPPCRW